MASEMVVVGIAPKTIRVVAPAECSLCTPEASEDKDALCQAHLIEAMILGNLDA